MFPTLELGLGGIRYLKSAWNRVTSVSMSKVVNYFTRSPPAFSTNWQSLLFFNYFLHAFPHHSFYVQWNFNAKFIYHEFLTSNSSYMISDYKFIAYLSFKKLFSSVPVKNKKIKIAYAIISLMHSLNKRNSESSNLWLKWF